MRQLEGLASVLEAERFERKLKTLSKLKPTSKQRRLYSLKYQEENMAYTHRVSNEDIEARRLRIAEWHRENPDGEFPED